MGVSRFFGVGNSVPPRQQAGLLKGHELGQTPENARWYGNQADE
jgi:hypothetical protein